MLKSPEAQNMTSKALT
jgi:hypothetical protein